MRLETQHPDRGSDAPQDALQVLVADDGEDNRRLTQFFLERAGFDVVLVTDGDKAVEQVAERQDSGQPFALILMDMQMPRLDGYEATRQIRDLGYDGPVIALTASNMPGDKTECLAAGCNDFVPKPFEFQKLVDLVCSYVQKD